MAKDLNRSIKIFLDNTSAMTSAEELQGRIGDLEKKLLDLQTAGQGNSKQAKTLTKELAAQTEKFESYKQKVADTERVVRNLSGATHDELLGAKRELDKQLKKTTRGTEEYNQKLLLHKRLSKEVALVQRDMRTELGCQSTMWGRSADFINKYMGLIGSAIAGVTGITMAFGKLRDERDKLEASSANTKALTGLGDEDVQTLEDAAKRLSTTVTKEGVRIKQSAVEISDSFAVIGSQRPELLKSAEALEQVTQDAIYLSIAGKDKLEPAAKALTTVMNQMNLGADQSRRIINAIAAGSQAGAGNIQYITDAFEKSGTSANLMNIQLEQHIGLIEAVAPKYSEAAVAGNSLDKVLLKMKEKNIGYKDGVFDLSRAIDEIAARFKKGESAASLFGAEHAKMAEILVMNKADIIKYTEAVTGTNKAVEQANINSDINEVKRAQARNKMNLLGIELMDKLNPAINSTMNQMVHWTGKLVTTADWLSKNGKLVVSLVTVLGLYTVALKLNTYWTTLKGKATSADTLAEQKKLIVLRGSIAAEYASAAAKALLTGNIKAATIAMRGFLVTLGLNPVVAMGVAIAALTVGIYKLCTRTTEADEAMKSFFESSIKEEAELNKLYGALKRSGEGTELRTKLLGEFNTKYGEYLPHLLTEKSTLEEIKTAYDNATIAMKENLAQKTLDKGTEDIEQTALEDKANLLLNIKEKMADLPESVVKDALGAITKLTDKGVEAGLDVDTTWKSVLERIRKEFYGGDNKSLTWANDLDEYVKKVYETAGKIDDLREKLNPFLPKKASPEKPANELEEVVVTPDRINKPTVDPKSAAEAEKKILDAKLKEVDQYVLQEQLKLKGSYLQNLRDKEDYHRQLEMLELEALNRRMTIYGLDKDKQAEIQDKILSYKVKILEQTRKFEESQDKYRQKADKKEEKAKKKVLNDDLKRIVAKNNEQQATEYDEQQKHQERLKELASGFSTEIGTILGGAIAGNNDLVKSSLIAIINMGLDALEVTAQMAAAEAVIKGGGQGGLIGLAKGAVVAGLIKIAFSGVKALVGSMVNNIGKGDSASSAVSSNSSSPNTGNRVVANEFFVGGDTGGESPYEVVGMVHGQEYVVPSFVYKQPAAMNHIAALEAMRRQKTNANPLPGSVVGFATGGHSGDSTSENRSAESDKTLLSVMQRLIILLGNLEGGIKAYVVYSDLERKKQTLDKTRRLGGK